MRILVQIPIHILTTGEIYPPCSKWENIHEFCVLVAYCHKIHVLSYVGVGENLAWVIYIKYLDFQQFVKLFCYIYCSSAGKHVTYIYVHIYVSHTVVSKLRGKWENETSSR